MLCGTKKEIAKESVCIKYPALCDEALPQKAKESAFKKWILYALYGCVALLLFTVIYRNCCGGDGNAMNLITAAMKDLNQGVKDAPLPKDAVNVSQFTALAGFDEEELFSQENPNPLLIAEAQLSLEKILKAMKKR